MIRPIKATSDARSGVCFSFLTEIGNKWAQGCLFCKSSGKITIWSLLHLPDIFLAQTCCGVGEIRSFFVNSFAFGRSESLCAGTSMSILQELSSHVFLVERLGIYRMGIYSLPGSSKCLFPHAHTWVSPEIPKIHDSNKGRATTLAFSSILKSPSWIVNLELSNLVPS